MKPLFVVVEGPEGAGKSTLARWLVARLEAEGWPVVVGRARQRRARKFRDRFERQGDAFHRRVLQAYRGASGPGVVHIDASQSRQAVQDAAWREVMAASAPTLRGVS